MGIADVADSAGWAGGLLDCKTIEEAGSSLRQRSDSVLMWHMECCRKKSSATEQSSIAYASYRKFTRAAGRAPVGQSAFNKSLNDQGFPLQHHREHNRVVGFALADRPGPR